MSDFQFTRSTLDHHEESIGVDMRPPIDLTLDRQAVQQFYNLATERFGGVFQNVEQGPNVFRISRPVPMPQRRGEVTVQTFVLTPRGPSFNFPRSAMGIEEFPWPDPATDLVLECLKILSGQFPTHRFIRIGKVRNLIFPCGSEDSAGIVRKRFCAGVPEDVSDVSVGWNRQDDKFNVKIHITGVEQRAVQQSPGGGAIPQRTGQYGVKVMLDVNNKQMNRPLDEDQMRIILTKADSVFEEELMDILNGGSSA